VKSAETEEGRREEIGEVREEIATERAIVSPAETEKIEVESEDVEEPEIELDPVGLSDDVQNINIVRQDCPFLFYSLFKFSNIFPQH
jgi:uncharacterized sporulation protein YeaH/YhbH (DUF444 family)